jgi:hypothetical protein
VPEGDGEAAGLGEEVTAVAEAVRPLPVAECPAGFDELAVMGRAAQRLDLSKRAEPISGQPRSIGGLGGVLGNVVRYGAAGECVSGPERMGRVSVSAPNRTRSVRPVVPTSAVIVCRCDVIGWTMPREPKAVCGERSPGWLPHLGQQAPPMAGRPVPTLPR